MNNLFLSEFIDNIKNKFSGQIPNLIYFAIGIGIGIILFIILLVIILIINRPKQSKKAKSIENNIEPSDAYIGIVKANIDLFNTFYRHEKIMKQLEGLLKILLDMTESIASIYYPDSEDPMFEISTEQLVEFLEYCALRINHIVDRILEDKFPIIDIVTKHSLKDKKISFAFEAIEKKLTQQEEKKNIISKMKGAVLRTVGKIAINSEFEDLLNDIGSDLNKLYSKQELVFTDITKKAMKKQMKIEAKKLKNEVKEYE